MTSKTPLGRTLFVHWGRTGGGPRVLEEMTREFALRRPGDAAVSYNVDAENAAVMEHLGLPSVKVTTFSSALGVVLNLPKMVRNSFRVRSFVRRHAVSTVVCTMESVYQSLLVPLLLPRSVHYVFAVHDGAFHPGDANVVRRLNRWVELRRADSIVTFSESVAEVMRGLDECRTTKIVSSVLPASDARGHEADVRHLPVDRPVVVGFFGRLVAYKGLELLLEAAELLSARGVSVIVKIVGNGERGRELAALPAPANVRWDVRWVPEDEVVPIVGSFDVLALPYTEASQSGVLAQALSLGVPSVATPVGGLAEQVTTTGAGVVASAVSAEAFADAVEALCTDRHTYARCSEGCLEAAAGSYSWTRFLDDLESVIED